MVEGVGRSKLIAKLNNMWSFCYSESAYLKSVSIGNGNPLRGIRDSKLDIKFPVTVLCGMNGTGKTTFLALSALAFHGKSGPSRNKKYYDFNYFFTSSDKDRHSEGVVIDWQYTNSSSDSIKKGRQRWMRYIKNSGEPRRPKREVKFVGLSRIVPAFEKRGYPKLFSNVKKSTLRQLQDDAINYADKIMGRSCGIVNFYEVDDHSGRHRLNGYKTHTGFNAGAGEECLVSILDALISSEDGSLIIIEEIEVGLHPSMIRNLVDIILEITYKKKHQVLITTHSPEFLRECPRESLVLIERENDKIHFTHEPNVESVIANIGGRYSKELYILCEDSVAADFIRNSMTSEQRQLSEIKAYGGKNELARKGRQLKEWSGKKVMIIWDGDVEDGIMKELPEDITGKKLPFSSSPEGFIISLFKNDTLKAEIIQKYRLSDPEWINMKNRVLTAENVHGVFYNVSCCLSMESDLNMVRTQIIDMVCRLSSDMLNTISDDIDRVLDRIALRNDTR